MRYRPPAPGSGRERGPVPHGDCSGLEILAIHELKLDALAAAEDVPPESRRAILEGQVALQALDRRR
ncbi:hypothetical protein GCM10027062_21330 [Nocardioides hungaricus]